MYDAVDWNVSQYKKVSAFQSLEISVDKILMAYNIKSKYIETQFKTSNQVVNPWSYIMHYYSIADDPRIFSRVVYQSDSFFYFHKWQSVGPPQSRRLNTYKFIMWSNQKLIKKKSTEITYMYTLLLYLMLAFWFLSITLSWFIYWNICVYLLCQTLQELWCKLISRIASTIELLIILLIEIWKLH